MSSLEGATNPRDPASEELTDAELALMGKLFGNPRLWPDTAKVWIADYVAQNSLLPISQVQGFSQYVARQAIVLTQETTTSTTYTDLATAGPTLTGIPPGQYLVFYGARMFNSANSNTAYLGLSVNGGAVSADDVLLYAAPSAGSIPALHFTRISLKTFTDPNNSIQMKYKGDAAGTANFLHRSLVILRVANP